MMNKHILKECHTKGFKQDEVYGAYKIFFATLVSESRLKILNLLRNNKKNVSEIVNELNMDQTAVSHDLKRLKDCGFVNVEIEGKYRYYTINKQTIMPLMEIIDKHMSQNCVHILRNRKGE